MPTTPIITTVSGATFSVNTTGAELDSTLTIRDFIVLENGVLTINPLSYTKSTANSIAYSGPTLPSTTLEIRRSTPRAQRTVVLPGTKVRSIDWNLEFDRRVRIQEEIDLYGAGGGFSVRLPVDAAYGVAWSGDTLFSPTRNSLYNKFETTAPINNPTFTGVVTLPTGLLVSDNSLRAATTAYVQSNITTLAPIASPALTGNPTAPTQLVTDNSTRLATTAYVRSQLYSTLDSPTFTGNVNVPTVATATNSTLVASTAYVKNNLSVFAPLASPVLTGTPTAPTPLPNDNSTTLATTQFVQRRSRPMLIASRITSTQALAVTVENPLIWNNAIRDVDAMLNTTTGVITLPRVGFYHIDCVAYYAGTATFGSLSVIDGTALTRLARFDFTGNVASALPLAGSVLFYASAANTQIRLSVSDLSVAGTLNFEASVTARTLAHMSVYYVGNDV